MKLLYATTGFDRGLASMIGVELDDKYIKLNKSEVAILQQAHDICYKADMALRDYRKDPDYYNEFTSAWCGLSDIDGVE